MKHEATMTRAEQLKELDRIWRGWCQDEKCPNNVCYGVKTGSSIQPRPPNWQ